MNILVTGFKGFIGKHIFNFFNENGFDVKGFDWEENTFPNLEKYDWVIHCGAISDTTERNVEKIFKQNYNFTFKLIKECNKNNTNIQLSSTSAVYGPNKLFNEKDPVYPQTPYAWSKYLIDKHLVDRLLNETNILIQSFRYFNVYGPGEDHKEDQQSMVSKFQQQARLEGEIKLFKNSIKYKRDLVCVHDVCKVHYEMIKKDVSGIFNLGTGKTNNIEEIAKLIAKHTGSKIRYIDMPKNLKGQYQEYTCADNLKLNKYISIKDWITVEEYLTKYQ